MTIQRYNPGWFKDDLGFRVAVDMTGPREGGEYVLYSDHVAATEELKARLEKRFHQVADLASRAIVAEVQLAANTWQPITPENLPHVGDEVYEVKTCMGNDWTAADYEGHGFTHFRPKETK